MDGLLEIGHFPLKFGNAISKICSHLALRLSILSMINRMLLRYQ
jgi:hypothetical protein